MSYAIDVLARTIYGEARGESLDGQIAVAWVIVNRVKKATWWGDTIASVCHADKQFSAWNMKDPNRKKMEFIDLNDEGFRQCYGVACLVTAGTFPDPTKGSTHYHTKSISPNWAEGSEPCYEAGSHVFYNNIR